MTFGNIGSSSLCKQSLESKLAFTRDFYGWTPILRARCEERPRAEKVQLCPGTSVAGWSFEDMGQRGKEKVQADLLAKQTASE